MPSNLQIRYHFPLEVALDPRVPVIIETLISNSTDFMQWGIAPIRRRGVARPPNAARRSAPLLAGAWKGAT